MEYITVNGIEEIDTQIKATIDSLNIVNFLVKEEWKQIKNEKEHLNIRKKKIDQLESELYHSLDQFSKDAKLSEVLNKQTSDQVNLNVGGQFFSTTRSTLCSIEGTMLSAMFSGRHNLSQDSEGRYFLDRDPEFFRIVLNYLRNHKLALPHHSAQLCADVLEEFDYYCVPLDYRQVQDRFVDTLSLVNQKAVSAVRVQGDVVASTSYRGTVCLWWLGSRQQWKTLRVPATLECLDLTENYLACGGEGMEEGEGGVVYVWDVKTWEPKILRRNRRPTVCCVKISRTNYMTGVAVLVTGSDDAMVEVWELPKGERSHTLVGHLGAVTSVDIQGQMVASGSLDQTIRVWDLPSGACVHTLVGHTGWVEVVKLNGATLISASSDNSLKIWDLDKGVCLRTLLGHDNPVCCLDVVGTMIVSGACDRGVKVWDATTGCCWKTMVLHRNGGEGVGVVEVVRDLLVSAVGDNKMFGVWCPVSCAAKPMWKEENVEEGQKILKVEK